MTETVSHPIFARVLDRTCPAMEREVGPLRDELLAGLGGRVVEVGAGKGASFARYPPAVETVIAVEPEPYLRAKAGENARAAKLPVEVHDAFAGALPLEDASVDAGVVSEVLCSVPDPAAAIGELRRVVRPGGEIRFLEHVRSGGARKARVQRSLDAWLWPRLAGGCHCGRDTVAALEAAGLRIESMRP